MSKNIFIYTLLAILFSIPFIIISTYYGFIMGSPAGVPGLVNSILYISLWMLLSYFLGRKFISHFVIFIAFYWGVLLLIYVLAINSDVFSNNYFILASIFLISPFYGLTSLIEGSAFTIIVIGICGLLFSMSYFVGRRNPVL